MDLILFLLMAATVILACVICNRISGKLGIPMLLAFIILGMFFGSDGIVKISFDNFIFTEQICSVALIFIMFYGGFGTSMKEAKPIVIKAVLLSSLGTVVTAILVGCFCFYLLHIPLLESFLIGSVICSTDAASVFSILRAKKLNLREHTASLLEVESGSNDPFSYMLTIMILTLMGGKISGGAFLLLLIKQLFLGVLFGVLFAVLAYELLKRTKVVTAGFDAIFLVSVAVFSYALTSYFGGNGYLSVYLTGMILGNRDISNKLSLVHFFDATTGLMQMVLFFLLGLLSFPSKLKVVAGTALLIALFLTFIARPLAVSLILLPFKSSLRQIILVSWSGMRGAASIVFAIMVVIASVSTENDIFHIVFFIVLFSILLQGTLIPMIAKKLNMTDEEGDVMKTFTDYTDEVPVQFLQVRLYADHPWIGKQIREVIMPPDLLLVLLVRQEKKMIPNGNTILHADDTLIISGRAGGEMEGIHLYEKKIEAGDKMIHKQIRELRSREALIILIKRGKNVIIPRGNTILKEQDILVIHENGL